MYLFLGTFFILLQMKPKRTVLSELAERGAKEGRKWGWGGGGEEGGGKGVYRRPKLERDTM